VEAIPEKRIRKKESKHLPHFMKDDQNVAIRDARNLLSQSAHFAMFFYAGALTETVSCNFINKI
jgi:hypothetical protein